jgi:hypothetical protein
MPLQTPVQPTLKDTKVGDVLNYHAVKTRHGAYDDGTRWEVVKIGRKWVTAKRVHDKWQIEDRFLIETGARDTGGYGSGTSGYLRTDEMLAWYQRVQDARDVLDRIGLQFKGYSRPTEDRVVAIADALLPLVEELGL